MKDLTTAMGMTKGAFYHHFVDKESLMRECLKATIAFAERKVFAPCRSPELPLPQKVALMTGGLRELFSRGDGGCFIANTALETAQVEDTFLELTQAFIDGWASALRQMATDAGYPADEIETVVRQLLMLTEGAIVLMQVYDKDDYLETAITQIQQKLQAR
jgi:TetR/AcrR family transcriptional repressor of nem operon